MRRVQERAYGFGPVQFPTSDKLARLMDKSLSGLDRELILQFPWRASAVFSTSILAPAHQMVENFSKSANESFLDGAAAATISEAVQMCRMDWRFTTGADRIRWHSLHQHQICYQCPRPTAQTLLALACDGQRSPYLRPSSGAWYATSSTFRKTFSTRLGAEVVSSLIRVNSSADYVAASATDRSQSGRSFAILSMVLNSSCSQKRAQTEYVRTSARFRFQPNASGDKTDLRAPKPAGPSTRRNIAVPRRCLPRHAGPGPTRES